MKSSRRAARRLRPRPILGVPSLATGGPAARATAVATAMGGAALLAALPMTTLSPAAAARERDVRSTDLPVARTSVTHCDGGPIRVEIVIPFHAGAATNTFRIKGKSYDLRDLRRYVRAMADLKHEGEGPNAASALVVLIRAHRATPWHRIQEVLRVCADPTVRVYKLQFAVRPPVDEQLR